VGATFGPRRSSFCRVKDLKGWWFSSDEASEKEEGLEDEQTDSEMATEESLGCDATDMMDRRRSE